MENNLVYSNVATELIEIFKYFDSTLSGKIPKNLKENLNKIKNKEHKFKIDKTKELDEQDVLPETKQILSIMYLKYFCSTEEADAIIEESKRKEIIDEKEKREKFNPDNIFKDKQVYQEEQEDNMKLIEYVEYIPIHKRIINKVKDFFKNILRR